MFRRLLFFSLIVFSFHKKYLLESEGKAGKSGDYVDNQIKNQPGEKENIGGNQDVEKNFNRHLFTPGKA